jgi:hypothetical protein
MLAEVAKQKGISLCGIQRDKTTADFSGCALKPPDTILLASDLSQAVVTGALTHLSLVGNEKLGDEGVEALSVAIEQSKSLRTLDLSSDSECQPCSTRVSTMFGPKGATALAKALAINSSLTQIEYAGSMNAALWAPSYNVCFLVFVPAGCRATTLERRVPQRSRTPCTSTARSGRYVSLSAHTRLTPLS